MTLLAQLPDAVKLQASFTPVLGDGDTGGIAAALALLSRFDPDALSADLELGVGGDISLRVDIDPEAAVRSAIDVAGPALEGVIGDPESLLAPLSGAINAVQAAGGTAGADFAAALTAAGQALQQALGGTGTQALQELIAPLVGPLDAVHAEFALGGFETLRAWGAQLETLRTDIEPLLANPPAAAAAALTEFFAGRLEKLGLSIAGPAVSLDLDLAPLGDAQVRFGELIGQIEIAFAAAAAAFEAGSPVNRAELNAALSLWAELTAVIEKIDAWLTAALDRLPDLGALMKIVAERLAAAEEIEIIDLANLREALAGPVAKVEALIDKLDFEAALKPLTDAIAKIEAALSAAKIPGVSDALGAALSNVDAAIGKLEAIWLDTVMLLKAAIAGAVDKLKSALAPLGTWTQDGKLDLAFAGQIEELMTTLDETLAETVLPALHRLAAGLDQSLGNAAEAIEQALAAIPNLAGELEAALSSAAAELQALDLPGRIATARDRLDAALSSLSTLELDPIVDPVIAELEEMRDAIAQLDFSAMGEMQLGALKVSASVVMEIDFKTTIADAIIAEMDEIVAVPRRALDAISARIEDALSRLELLSPDTILEPLEAPLAELKAALDALSLDGIAAPVAEWREKMLAGLDAFSPATLLAPLTDLSADLAAKVEAISLDALEAKVGELLDTALAPVAEVDIAAPLGALTGAVDAAKARLDAISADGLIAPLAERHQALVRAVEDFGPEELLAPFSVLFQSLTAPLAALSDDMAARIGAAIGVLKSAIDRLDPTKATEALAAALDQAAGVARAVDTAAATVRLRSVHGGLRAAFEAHTGPADVDLKVSVHGLNPLRSDALTKLSATAKTVDARLAEVKKAGVSVAEGYAEIREKLERLVPGWAEGTLDASRIKAAIASADPLGLAPLLEGIHTRLRDKVAALDPTQLGGAVEAAKAPVKAQLDAIDLTPLAERLSGIPERIAAAVGTIDKDLLGEEAAPSIGALMSVAGALDPTSLIERLDAPHQALRDRVAALDPLKVLEPLEAVLARVRAAGEALDLDILRAPIAAVFAEIEEMVAALDIADILTPLNGLLEQLRSELEEALRRAEDAFNSLVGALPK